MALGGSGGARASFGSAALRSSAALAPLLPTDLGSVLEPLRILGPGEVSEWLMVPLSKSGVVDSHRGFESRPLRHISIVT